jgi:uncharacterized protein YecE (DUF72 family)
MIWIGTSGWVYPHWRGRFYPADLPVRDQLAYYARTFSTVEINRSFYRLPTYDQFQSWREQVQAQVGFRFAVKASRYITHMRKLQHAEEGVTRLYSAAAGLGEHLGPMLYQLPPRWHANPSRLEEFLTLLPHDREAAFEFRDASWLQADTLLQLRAPFEQAGAALALSVGGSCPTPLELPAIGPFCYVRFHHGSHGIGLTDDELTCWAKRLAVESAGGREVYAYFNNDAEGYAIVNALRLRQLLEHEGAELPAPGSRPAPSE